MTCEEGRDSIHYTACDCREKYFADLKAKNAKLQERVAELEKVAELADWARHDEGCCYIHDKAYGCRCGFLTAKEAAYSQKGPK